MCIRDRLSTGFVLIICDNGRGFDPGLRRQGLGLVGLRERVEVLDGNFHLRSAPGQGARISASIPLRNKK